MQAGYTGLGEATDAHCDEQTSQWDQQSALKNGLIRSSVQWQPDLKVAAVHLKGRGGTAIEVQSLIQGMPSETAYS